MIGLCLIGATGRTGSHVLKVLGEYSNFKLTAAIVSPSSKSLGRKVGIGDIAYSSELAEGVLSSDVVVDFSTPDITAAVLSACSKYRKPLLIATTGHKSGFDETLKVASKSIPIILASNTSLGVCVLHELAAQAAKLLGGFDVEIVETHHKHKKDAPSGTAKSVAQKIGDAIDARPIFNRTGVRDGGTIGIVSVRGGDVAGEHTVMFLGPSERIEISHRASDRGVFARGSLQLADKLVGCEAGLYSPADIYLK